MTLSHYAGLKRVPQNSCPPRTSKCDFLHLEIGSMQTVKNEMRSSWNRVGHKSNENTLVRTEQGRHRESCLNLEARTGIMQLCIHKPRNTKDCWEPPEAGRGKEFFPRAFRDSMAFINTLISEF